MNRYVFWGPRGELINKYNLDNYYSFSQLVRIIQKEEKTLEIKGVEHKTTEDIGTINKLVIFSDEYSMVNEWVLYNLDEFLNRFDIENVYIQNPPNYVYDRLSKYGEIIEEKCNYSKINIDSVKNINKDFSNYVIGQECAKNKIINMLYSATFDFFNNKPLVLMFYGPSGVGKTETAKFIASKMGGNLFRKQFSMFQNNEFANYLFGNKHNESSFAKDLLDREANVILLDEFDKANNLFFSAFYQLFDEGIFVDKNYSVALKDSIIICTSNYETTDEIKEKLGLPIYNRFDNFIYFKKLDEISCRIIIEKYYKKYYECLNNEQQKVIDEYGVKELILNKSSYFNNVREIDRIIREVIIDVLIKYEI